MRFPYLIATLFVLALAAGAQSVGTVSPATVSFGPVFVGTTSPRIVVKFENSGSTTIVVSSVSVTPPFVIAANACKKVKPSLHCNVAVVYAPQAIETDSGSLTFSDNASNSQQTVSLAGTGSNFKTLYKFPAAQDQPNGGLTMDAAGDLYGTTSQGGNVRRNGTIFKLTASDSKSTVYNFAGTYGADGSAPEDSMIMDGEGNMYGTTLAGGGDFKTQSPNCGLFFPGCGAIFELTAGGTESVLYSFQGGPADGQNPYGSLVMDSVGNLYGTTITGGSYTNPNCYSAGCGTIFKVTPQGVETVLYSFCSEASCVDGSWPYGGLVMDSLGNLYGTTSEGGSSTNCGNTGCGTVFELTTDGTESVLHNFGGYPNDGAAPLDGLLMDAENNLYGTTSQGGSASNCKNGTVAVGCGTVFELAPNGTETILHKFAGFPSDGAVPYAALIMDSQGNLYGTTEAGRSGGGCAGGIGCGSIFEVSPSGNETVLYTFCSLAKCADGGWPKDSLIMDANGVLYGTTSAGGVGNGTVFKLKP